MSSIPLRRSIVWAAALIAAASLGACQTARAPHQGFSTDQTRLLGEQGFVETADGWQLSIADRLLFDIDSSTLRIETRDAIGRIAAALQSVGIDTARVEGHSDSTGAAAYNLQLSLARAQAVAAAMQTTGYLPGNMRVRGWGETRPIADNGLDEGRAANRRVVIIVSPQL